MTSWIRRYTDVPDAPARLLCLPHAGGAATYYLPLARMLAPAVEVVAVQYPGRQERHRETPSDRIDVLADHVADAARSLADRPLAIFGHSMGAVVGYEVALRLEASGITPARLFASARRAPSRVRDDNVHRLDDRALADHIRRLGGTHTDVLDDAELLATLMSALRADHRAIETYRAEPGRRLRCPVTALFGDSDPSMTAGEAADWARHTVAPFDLRSFPGGHFYLADRSTEVADLLRTHLTGTIRPAPVGGPL